MTHPGSPFSPGQQGTVGTVKDMQTYILSNKALESVTLLSQGDELTSKKCEVICWCRETPGAQSAAWMLGAHVHAFVSKLNGPFYLW